MVKSQTHLVRGSVRSTWRYIVEWDDPFTIQRATRWPRTYFAAELYQNCTEIDPVLGETNDDRILIGVISKS